jgi:hypothetical protein
MLKQRPSLPPDLHVGGGCSLVMIVSGMHRPLSASHFASLLERLPGIRAELTQCALPPALHSHAASFVMSSFVGSPSVQPISPCEAGSVPFAVSDAPSGPPVPGISATLHAARPVTTTAIANADEKREVEREGRTDMSFATDSYKKRTNGRLFSLTGRSWGRSTCFAPDHSEITLDGSLASRGYEVDVR